MKYLFIQLFDSFNEKIVVTKLMKYELLLKRVINVKIIFCNGCSVCTFCKYIKLRICSLASVLVKEQGIKNIYQINFLHS